MLHDSVLCKNNVEARSKRVVFFRTGYSQQWQNSTGAPWFFLNGS
ncbi:hypothetical protein TOI97_10735 [Denitrificimonas sp. JX-1]|uniref:Uncharacterized protein n=1 Tax=Denitrificimonas halotolerans TaxID=3098930 RepID=A0ABU5GU58_9GAMM|nr:hypothetical protein [Denitrificimonas sp. JX-1]MDY7220037.1 hypothetical protein [Denitrificimonas sp. JX-1]